MHDHNLDDLIIDDINPNNSKTKSFLTIIALAIVVLIVAIILTKIILKDTNERAILEEDTTLISPELTLQNVSKKENLTLNKSPKVVKEIINTQDDTARQKKAQEKRARAERAKRAKEAEESQIAEEKIRADNLAKEKAKEAQRKAIAELKSQKEKYVAKPKKERPVTVKPVKKPVPKPVAKAQGHFFIQVGAFSKTPSKRFLSTITKNGFKYQITAATTTGAKKLLIGPYSTRTAAAKAITRVKDRINKSAFILRR